MIRIQYVPPSNPSQIPELQHGPLGPDTHQQPAVNPYQTEQTDFKRERASRLGFRHVGQAARAQRNVDDSLQLSKEWRQLARKAAGPWQLLHDATTQLGPDGQPNMNALRQAQARLHHWVRTQAAGKKLTPELQAQVAKVDALVGRMVRRNLPMGEMPVSNSFQAPASGWSPLLQVFDKVLPASPNSQHRKARKLWDEGRTAEALDLLETASERAPKNARLKLDLGRLLTEEGFYPEAEWSLVELAADHPRQAEVQAALGELYVQMGQPLLAMEAFKQTLKLDPDHTDAHLQLGVAHYEQGNLDEAAPHLQRAIRLDQKNPVARFYMAQISLQENDLLRARYQLGMVAKLAPEMDLTRFGENAPPPLTSRTVRREPPAHHWQLPQVRSAKTAPLDPRQAGTRRLND